MPVSSVKRDERRVVAAVVFIDVGGPVRPVERLVGRRLVGRGRRLRPAAAGRARGERERGRAGTRAGEQRAAIQLRLTRLGDQGADHRVLGKGPAAHGDSIRVAGACGVGRYCHTAGEFARDHVRIVNFWRTSDADSVLSIALPTTFSVVRDRWPARSCTERARARSPSTAPTALVEERRQGRDPARATRYSRGPPCTTIDGLLADRARRAPSSPPMRRHRRRTPSAARRSARAAIAARAATSAAGVEQDRHAARRGQRRRGSARGDAATTAYDPAAAAARARGTCAARRRRRAVRVDELHAMPAPLPGARRVVGAPEPPTPPACTRSERVGWRSSSRARSSRMPDPSPCGSTAAAATASPRCRALAEQRLDHVERRLPIVVGPRPEARRRDRR